MIINHNSEAYRKHWKGKNHENGAYYYSVEICKNIIPNVKTDRHWVTIHCDDCYDHSIVFIHNNLHPQRYDFLKDYSDLILVCSQKDTMDKVRKYGTPIYVPLSIDVDYVKKFKRDGGKYQTPVYVGRLAKLHKIPHMHIPFPLKLIHGKREDVLKEMAKYKNVYAVGRCALEAKVLGCNILPFDFRFPDPSVWEVIDNKEAAKILQTELDKIDGRKDNE